MNTARIDVQSIPEDELRETVRRERQEFARTVAVRQKEADDDAKIIQLLELRVQCLEYYIKWEPSGPIWASKFEGLKVENNELRKRTVMLKRSLHVNQVQYQLLNSEHEKCKGSQSIKTGNEQGSTIMEDEEDEIAYKESGWSASA
ncbi:MAG: hypothetical protein LQ343_007346 [Gyalolechia ehrenbergii]|nr:MAG: hypothetical protein LQ343_007346 [Gyalolechia ehrenbergii]